MPNGKIKRRLMDGKRTPLCPNCNKPMHLMRTIPGIDLPELRTYICKACGVAVAEEEHPRERSDLTS
jgi:hypothetical protein